MRKKLILIILLILALLTAGLVYLNSVFLPIQLKEIIIREASKKLNRKVSIASLYYAPLKGLVFNRVAIQDQAPQTENIFSAQEISVTIFYLPLLTQKKIIIPSIVIDKPVITLSLERTGLWNFSDLLTLNENKKGQKEQTPAIFISGLTINSGTVIFFDKNIAREAIETVENINIRASLALPDSVKATIKIFPKKQGALKIFSDINYNFLSKDFLCQLRAENIDFAKIAPYINKPDFALQKAKINVASLDLSRRGTKVSGKGEFFFDQTELLLQNKINLLFLPSLRINDITMAGKELRFKGLLEIKQGELLLGKNERIASDLTYDFILVKNENKITAEGNIAAPNLTGTLDPKTNVTVQAQGKADFSHDNGLFQSQSRLNFQNMTLNLSPNAQLTGNPLLNFSFKYRPVEGQAPELSYSGTMSVTDAKGINLPYLQTAENVSGKISFEPNKFAVDSLTALISQTPMALSGSVENFKEPFLDIDFSATNCDLGAWQDLISQYVPNMGIDAKGIATFKLKYKGKIKRLAGASIDCTAALKDVAFKNKAMKNGVFNISGDIHYVVEHLNPSHFLPDEGSWKDLRFTFQDKPYVLNGTLQFNNLVTTLKCEDLLLSLNSKLFPDRLKILSLTGQYHNSQANVAGEVFYPNEKQGPKFNIKIGGSIALEDLPALFPELKERLDPVVPQGIFAIDGLFAGDLQQWKDWTLAFTLTSNEASFYHYKVSQLSLKYAQRDRFINQCTLNSAFYNGAVALEGSSDLSIAEMPYKIAIDIKKVDLSKLKEDTPLKTKDLSGLLSASYTGTGPLSNLNFSQGQGFLSVKDGKLWQFDIFKGLAQLLFVPENQNITLDSAEGNFSVVSEKVLVKDAIVKGNQVELTCNGSATFKGDLDFDIISKFAEGVIRSSDSLQKTVAAFLSQAEDLVTVKVTGTLKEPKYKIMARPLNVIQKTKDFILDTLPNIFQ